MSNTVTISKEEYEKMLDELKFLDMLRSAGVDNWVGYGDVCESLKEEENNG